MTHHRPSSARVFGKSMHVIAAGWALSVWWLWLAGVRQHLRRQGVMPPDFGLPILLVGAVAALIIWAVAVGFVRWSGPAPHAAIERREWRHAFWWALFPNVMLLGTVYLMITATA